MAVFRVQKTKQYTVMSNRHLRSKTLSLKAKGLLSQMLSLPDDWDYTLRGLAAINREGVTAIRTALHELEAAGYLVRRQCIDARRRFTDTEYLIYEQPLTPDEVRQVLRDGADALPGEGPDEGREPRLCTARKTGGKARPAQRADASIGPYEAQGEASACQTTPQSAARTAPLRRGAFLNGPAGRRATPQPFARPDLPLSDFPTAEVPAAEKSAQQKKEKPKKDPQNTESYPAARRNDGMRCGAQGRQALEQRLRRNIGYDRLRREQGADPDLLDEVVEQLLDLAASPRPTVRVAGGEYPAAFVRQRMLRLDGDHIRYVLDCLARNTTHIRNIRQYLRAALFNAPGTINCYYVTRAAHDLAAAAQKAAPRPNPWDWRAGFGDTA